MYPALPEAFGLAVLAAAFELIDSGLGMMYGTLLSPVRLALGYPAAQVVPSILLSQAAGGWSPRSRTTATATPTSPA